MSKDLGRPPYWDPMARCYELSCVEEDLSALVKDIGQLKFDYREDIESATKRLIKDLEHLLEFWENDEDSSWTK